MILVADAYLLMVVPIGRLALLVANQWHAMNAWYTALPIDELLVGILLFVLEVLARVQIELFLGVECVEVLEVGRIERVLKALLKRTNNIEILLVFSSLLRPMLAFLLRILLIVKIHDFRVTLLRWQLVIYI